MSYQETVTFELIRTDDGENEHIRVTFDSTNEDIHQTLKRFGNFLISLSYSPETIQQAFKEFDIEAL